MKMLFVVLSFLALNSLPVIAEEAASTMDGTTEGRAGDCEQCRKNAWSKRRTDPRADQIAEQILNSKRSPSFDPAESRQ